MALRMFSLVPMALVSFLWPGHYVGELALLYTYPDQSLGEFRCCCQWVDNRDIASLPLESCLQAFCLRASRPQPCQMMSRLSQISSMLATTCSSRLVHPGMDYSAREPCHRITYRIHRGNYHYQTYVVNLLYSARLSRTQSSFSLLWEKSAYISFHPRIQDTAVVFRYPNYMVLDTICTMPG